MWFHGPSSRESLLKTLFVKFYLIFILSIVLLCVGFIVFSHLTQVQFQKVKSNTEISSDVAGFLASMPNPVSLEHLDRVATTFARHSKKKLCFLDELYNKVNCPGKIKRFLPLVKKLQEGERLTRPNFMVLGPFTVISQQGPLKMFIWKKRRANSYSDAGLFLLKNSHYMVIFLAIILCILPWLYLSYTLFKPLSRLIRMVDGMAEGNFSEKVEQKDVQRKDVVGGLARVLQRMQQAVVLTQESNKTLVTRVAHEIHTPLTRIKLAAGLIIRKAPDLGLEQHVQDIERDCNELATTSNELMDLSRVSSGRVTGEVQAISLNLLLDRELAQFEGLFSHKGLLLEKTLTAMDGIQGYEKELSTVFKNIFENILKYAKDDSLVRVTSCVQEGRLLVECINVSEYVLPIEDLFEPFVHTSGHHQSHGLGLSFVKQVMLMHQGEVKFDYGHGIFSLKLFFPMLAVRP